MVILNSNDYIKVEDNGSIKKFLLESFIFENNFKLQCNNIEHSGILENPDYNNTSLLFSFHEPLHEDFKKGETYRLEFNNARGKFYTNIKLVDTFKKDKKNFLVAEFPKYLYRLQRRNSIRVITDSEEKALVIKYFFRGEELKFKTKDVGLDGFSILFNKNEVFPFKKKGEIYNLKLNFPDNDKEFNLTVKLIYFENFRAGFRLIDISKSLKNKILNYLTLLRQEIKNRKFFTDNDIDKKNITLGEWLKDLIEYEKEKFSNFKVAIITDKNSEEKFKFLKEKIPLSEIFSEVDFKEIIKFRPYLTVYHITDETKAQWYKFLKLKYFKNMPTIVVSDDVNFLRYQKGKQSLAVFIKESEIEKKLFQEIVNYSNVNIPLNLVDSKNDKPVYKGDKIKIGIIDDSIYGFSAKIILKDINFNVKLFENIKSFFKNDYRPEIIIFDATKYHINLSIEYIFKLNKIAKHVIITFFKEEPYYSKFLSIFSNDNLLIKPYNYDTLISKLMYFKDSIEEKSYIKNLPIYIISPEKEFFSLFNNLLNLYFPRGSFELVDITNDLSFDFREQKVFINLNAKYFFNELKMLRFKHLRNKNELIGAIYKPLHKNLINTYRNMGIEKLLILKDKEKFYEKFKEYYFLSE